MTVIGWKAAPEQFEPRELLECAAVAEEAGFESIDASDHFHPWSEAGQAAFVWTWLGAAAARTQRVLLGPGVTAPILRYHPAIIAQASATLGAMAPGRVFLAVGTGEALNDFAAVGEWPNYDERQEMLGEAIDLIRALWTGDHISWDGVYYETQKARLYTRPEQPIPLYVASMAPGSAFFAGVYGDGLFTTGGKEPDHYEQLFANFDAGAREAEKEPADLPRLIELRVAYTDDEEKAVEVTRKYWASAWIPAMFDEKIYDPREAEKNGEVVGKEAIVKKTCISADPRVQADFLGRYIDMGFTHIFVHSAEEDQRGFLKRYGREVLPLLRK